MTKKPSITLLEYALLGLICQKPSSGYDLRKIFATTSMGSFSDSPGAIYPALRRLQTRNLIEARAERTGRRREVFRATPRGQSELKSWLVLPVTRDDIASGLREFMLRFAFSEAALGRSGSIALLTRLRGELLSYIPEIRQQLAMLKMAPISAQLALECGIRGHESLLEWCEHALRVYKKEVS